MPESPTQLDKFKATAKELETDEDEARWDERLNKVVKHKPSPDRKDWAMLSLGGVVIALTIATPLHSQPTGGTTIFGSGNTSCGEWNEAKREGEWVYLVKQSWLLGMVSGLNASRHNGPDLLDKTDSAAIIGWVDSYCAANPLDKIGHAAIMLALELQKRARQ